MKFNEHGAETENIYKQFNIDKPDEVIDFSTNTNVLNISHDVSLDLKSLDFSTYPDIDNTEVVKSVINHIRTHAVQRIDQDNILITNGSNEAIYIIASYFMNDKVAIVEPTYPEYEKAFLAYNAQVSYCHELEDLLNNNYKCVVICNPNNPTGDYIPWGELEELINKLDKQGTTVVIDEAYIDFLTMIDESVLSKYKSLLSRNLIILRSLTKIFQIAGLRLGYVLSNVTWISHIRRRQPSWSVNSAASIVATELLDKENIIRETKAFYQEETQRVIDMLSKLGYEVQDTYVNFYLLKTSNDVKLIKHLLKRGIIVRHTRNHPGLDGGYVRIAVRRKEDNDYLIKALEEYIEG